MARITDGILPDDQELSVSLDRYQTIMRLPINAFNGLNNPDETPVYECSTIWKQSERDLLVEYLAEAEEMRETELHFHIAPKYLEDEEQDHRIPVILDWKYLVAVGTKATATISAGETVNKGAETAPNDPVTFTVTTTVTSTDEIRVFYPGEDVEITPSSVSISGGVATILVPRARLVKPTLNDDRDDHLSYYVNDNFLNTVDIMRVYTDTSDGAYIVWDSVGRVLAGVDTYPGSAETVQRANVQFTGKRARDLSIVHAYPADASGNPAMYTYCIEPSVVRISYLSGRRSSMRTELETARFAHTLMPNTPCTCPYVEQMWREDRETDPSGLVTPYGSSAGAVRAWLADARAKRGGGGKFPRV